MKKSHISIVVLIALIQITFTSCKKLENAERKTVIAPTVSSFKQIKADPSFNWKNTKVVSLNVIAANLPTEITNTLIVKSESGDVLFRKVQNMNETYVGNLTVPSKTEKLIISYGTIVKTLNIANGNVVMNYLK
jgi:hypothetical protein